MNITIYFLFLTMGFVFGFMVGFTMNIDSKLKENK